VGAVVLDSSVLLGLLNPKDAHHAAATAAVRDVKNRGQRVIVPATVVAEVLVSAARIGPEAIATAEAFIDAIADEVVAVDRAIARAAALLRANHPAIRLPDALIIAAGQVRVVDEIHTGDRRWRSVDPRVRLLDSGS
jgi:predicted nucleic acid-binding protein